MESKTAIQHKALLAFVGALAVAVLLIAATLGYVLLGYLPQEHQAFEAQLATIATTSNTQVLAASTTQNTLAVQLQETKQLLAEAQTPASTPTLATVIKQWSPLVPRVVCTFSSGDVSSQAGSGMLVKVSANNLQIWTNKHVVSTPDNTAPAQTCEATFLNGSHYMVSGSGVSLNSNTDFAYMSIANPDASLLHVTKNTITADLCKTPSSIGDEIVVLGYPSIGSNASITATEGIISGLEDNYYVTSAKVEYGNSGGIAIDVNRDCYLGIPTLVKSDSLESLARVLKWQAYEQQ